MNKNIIEINELIKRLEVCGYIDCGEFTDYTDDNEYASILFYLKNIQSLINYIREEDLINYFREINDLEIANKLEDLIGKEV